MSAREHVGRIRVRRLTNYVEKCFHLLTAGAVTFSFTPLCRDKRVGWN